MLCPSCGCSEPLRGFKAGKKHKRLRAFSGTMECANDHPWSKPLAYGPQFLSFCLIARPTVPHAPVESLAFALQKGLCQLLNIKPSDIGVSWRWMANRTAGSAQAEIILYDRTPGGAGFVRGGFDNRHLIVPVPSLFGTEQPSRIMRLGRIWRSGEGLLALQSRSMNRCRSEWRGRDAAFGHTGQAWPSPFCCESF